jgi:hypothetical protein
VKFIFHPISLYDAPDEQATSHWVDNIMKSTIHQLHRPISPNYRDCPMNNVVDLWSTTCCHSQEENDESSSVVTNSSMTEQEDSCMSVVSSSSSRCILMSDIEAITTEHDRCSSTSTTSQEFPCPTTPSLSYHVQNTPSDRFVSSFSSDQSCSTSITPMDQYLCTLRREKTLSSFHPQDRDDTTSLPQLLQFELVIDGAPISRPARKKIRMGEHEDKMKVQSNHNSRSSRWDSSGIRCTYTKRTVHHALVTNHARRSTHDRIPTIPGKKRDSDVTDRKNSTWNRTMEATLRVSSSTDIETSLSSSSAANGALRLMKQVSSFQSTSNNHHTTSISSSGGNNAFRSPSRNSNILPSPNQATKNDFAPSLPRRL